MRITAEEVRATAELARLELTAEELTRLERDAVPLFAPLRKDEVGPQLDAETALADAPRREGSFFEVPKIIEVSE